LHVYESPLTVAVYYSHAVSLTVKGTWGVAYGWPNYGASAPRSGCFKLQKILSYLEKSLV